VDAAKARPVKNFLHLFEQRRYISAFISMTIL